MAASCAASIERTAAHCHLQVSRTHHAPATPVAPKKCDQKKIELIPIPQSV
jgi:hypothetical protein